MAQRARFTPDYKGVGRILRSRQMQREMQQVAEQVKSKAEAIAPRDSGQYAASFRVEVGVREDNSRAQAKVINDDPIASYVEWGTSRTPRHRVLGRAAGFE